MSEIVFLNDAYLPRDQASINVMDRGFLFADGVYEVVRYFNGRPVAMAAHLERLARSLREVRIDFDMNRTDLAAVSDALVEKNEMGDAAVYWQVTRGAAAGRTHRFPGNVEPTVVAFAMAAEPLDLSAPVSEMSVVTRPDERWGRCDIKSVCLLANVLAQQSAVEAGCEEAILIRDGVVTEATAKSVFVVKRGTVYTHPLTAAILPSITREVLMGLMSEAGIRVIEEAWLAGRIYDADEILLASTTRQVASVVAVDDRPIGSGQAGPIARRLHRLAIDWTARECGIVARA